MAFQGQIRMVDISDKEFTERSARASVKIFASQKLIQKIKGKKLPKGDCLIPAQLAGIQAAKKAAEMIPLCHQIALSHVDIEFRFGTHFIEVASFVKARYATGVEMEALLACSVAGLAIYDMAKTESKDMVISDLKLLKKSGGKSGDYARGMK